MNQRLQKQAARPALGRPGQFQNFVALEELAVIEKMDASVQ